MLKIQKRNVIDLQDWDNLVEKVYGKPYSFQQQDGCKSRGVETISTSDDWLDDFENDSIPEVINGKEKGVSFKAWLERDPNAPLNCTEKEAKDCHYYWGGNKRRFKKMARR